MTACSSLSPYFMARRNTASPAAPSSAMPHRGMDKVALPTMQATSSPQGRAAKIGRAHV